MDTAAQSPPAAAQNASNAASTPQPAPKRRRTSGQPSSRGVANLTPEQLARKRQNDREAQRAIRERTKQQIERLNGRIRELESQQPYHELQMALRAKEAVQAENDDIRRRLSSVMTLIQPILGTHGLNGMSRPSAAAKTAVADFRPVQSWPPPPNQHMQIPDQRGYHHGVPQVQEPQPPHDQTSPSSPTSQSANGRNWGSAFPGVPPTSHVRGWHPAQPPYDQPRSNIHPDLEFGQNSDERLGVNFLLDNRAKLSNGLAHGGPAGMQSSGLDFNGRPMEAWNTLPRSLEATCPLDSLLLDFLAERHAQAAEGAAPLKSLVGPLYPDFSYLLNPDKPDQSHPLSKVFTDILRTFPDISGLPERVAVLYMMFLLMRWQIEPSQENYERLPDWMTPRPSQLFTPHPVWNDYLPWPRLRDRIIIDQPQQAFDNFFIPYTTSLSLNWPHNPRDCLLPASSVAAAAPSINTTPSGIPIDPATEASPAPPAPTSVTPEGSPKPAEREGSGDSSISGNSNADDGNGNADGSGDDDDQWVINPAFEAHLRNIDNWSLGPAFRAAFPELAAYVKIVEQ
ncbi:bzip transcription factor [Diplodia corticola]|uniref:Bzip transcription factor n=1 Tax=Diplodia corticola TaxID=236234 RepID=A0A1J9QRQ3_9PEZI|nr:bzip transcription factor [Diplodia corticola]OJD30690.1 bzip transcription factor [Diplodia corticola]